MKFEHLHIAGFGCLAGRDIEFANGLTIIAGPNEAGKSTIAECLMRLLFGFPESQYNSLRKKYEPWRSGAPYAASLRYRLDDGRRFEVARDFARADVPTDTVDADTRRPVPALSGNKSASPGESAFRFSLDVYRRAAVVGAGDFSSESNGAAHALADRLAAIVGSAGDASAAEAIERLKKVYGDIGLSGANTPLGKASREADDAEAELRRYRDAHIGLEENIRRQAELTDQVHELTARRARCAAALASVQLRSVRARIVEAHEARHALALAAARRSVVVSASPSALERRENVEAAAEALRLAEQAAVDASTRTSAHDSDKLTLHRDVDRANAMLLEKRALVARLDQTIAAHEHAASGRPPISMEALAQLERDADEADAAESRARTLETAAAIARQRTRPAATAAVGTLVAFVALTVAWLFTHAAPWGIAAGIFAVLTVALGIVFAGDIRRRDQIVARAETAAATAAGDAERISSGLAARCASMGCKDVAAVRAARTAQADLDRVRAERAAATEAAALAAAQRDALQNHYEDVNELDAERIAAQSRLDECRDALVELLDGVGVGAGPLEARLAQWNKLVRAEEDAARADAAVASAGTALERALRGKTIDELEEDATRHAAEAALGGDPGEFADHSETDLDRELGLVDIQLRDAERMLEGARGGIAQFEKLHPVKAPDLEERADAAIRRRDRLRSARFALETAWRTIEQVKDAVHRDFTPHLNAAVAKSAAAMTGGRYAQAWVDPADFTVRVRVPETGASLEAQALSTGTVEQFQFALRAALAAALGSGERVPIVYDDALAHADDARLKAALERAAELAGEGEQIVFLTQRGFVEEFAVEVPGVKLVRLAGPAG